MGKTNLLEDLFHAGGFYFHSFSSDQAIKSDRVANRKESWVTPEQQIDCHFGLGLSPAAPNRKEARVV
jgi:hypothetical protein